MPTSRTNILQQDQKPQTSPLIANPLVQKKALASSNAEVIHEHLRAWYGNKNLTVHQQVEASIVLLESKYLDGNARIQALQLCGWACIAILETEKYSDDRDRGFYEKVLESCNYGSGKEVFELIEVQDGVLDP